MYFYVTSFNLQNDRDRGIVIAVTDVVVNVAVVEIVNTVKEAEKEIANVTEIAIVTENESVITMSHTQGHAVENAIVIATENTEKEAAKRGKINE